MLSYKKIKTLSERISESNKIISKYPSSIPVIVETTDELLKNNIKKNKFLVPRDISVGHLLYSIRKQFKLVSNKAIFLFCDNKLLSGTSIMNELYENYKEKNKLNKDFDNFLYIQISSENTFG